MSALAPTSSDKRLSEQEQKLVITLLSDPTYFPIEFKSWLKLFIEQSDIRINATQIYGGGGTGAGAAVGLPAGLVLGVPGSVYPSDCIPCDGRLLIRNDFVKLFQAISTTWGAGDGTTSFNIPDLRDRALYGAGSRVGLGATDNRALGSRGGPSHYHQIDQTTTGGGAHGHGISGSYSGSTGDPGHHSHAAPSDNYALSAANQAALGSGGSNRWLVSNYAVQTGLSGAHSHSCSGSISGSADGVGAHTHQLQGPTSGGFGQDTPSFAGILWVITTGKD